MNDPADLARYSNQQLGNLIRDLRLQIAAYQAQLESPSAPGQRTIKVVRSTILTAGGIYGLTFTLLAALLAIIGFWDLIDTIRSDVDTMNQQLHFRRALWELTLLLDAAETELDRRMSEDRTR